ncbi:MAG: hypothetical protein KA028_03150 [Candidatus Pacebacteria bacterium]|nr:hypothetical protein [Candidatus Paceibacterota bacterium]MBP9852216.1 hypothetical protein [Candidatus Paceibacterota bacterium]
METVINKIKETIVKKFDPTGSKVMAHIKCGSFAGMILSKDVALLTDPDNENLHLTHPSMANDYQFPLISIAKGRNNIAINEYVGVEDYPEIMELLKMIKDTKWLN